MPTTGEYAKMAMAVYKPEGGSPPVGWELREYAKPPNRWGFCVAIYRNTAKREIVISFKGTDEWIQQLGNVGLANGEVPPQLGDAEEKVREVVDTYASSKPSAILAEAAQETLPPDFYIRLIEIISKAIIALLQGDFSTFRSLISELLDEAISIRNNFDKASPKLQEAIRKIQNANPNYKVCITGHSLGACIAELCAARFNLEATTFDSPGSKELISADPRYHQPNYSKITSYLAAPNIVNTLYGHVGTCYRVFIPYVEDDWTWEHAGKCVAAESARLLAYGLTLFSGGTTLPLAGAAAVGLTSIIAGGVSAASIFGLLPTSEDFRRQHSIDNIHTALTRVERLPVLMISWPKFSEIRWASFYTALRALAPLPADSPSMRVMLDQNGMIEEQIKRLDGYKESTEPSSGFGNNPNSHHSNNHSLTKGGNGNKKPPEMRQRLAPLATDKPFSPTIFGYVHAEENPRCLTSPNLLADTSENIRSLPTNKNETFISAFGISSMLVGLGGILYGKYYYHQKENTSYTDTPSVPIVKPIHDMNHRSYSFSECQPKFFSHQALPSMSASRLSNLVSKGRAGVFVSAAFATFYGGWQMTRQNKQIKVQSNIESVEWISPNVKK